MSHRSIAAIGIALLLIIFSSFSRPAPKKYRYAVVIRTEAYQDAEWKAVAEKLLEIHGGFESKLFQWNSSVFDIKVELCEFKPDYIGFIGRPVTDVSSNFVLSVHQLCRDLDDDIYADAVYGIITGYKASDAMRAIQDSVIVKTAVIAHQGQDFGGFHDPSNYPGYRHFHQSIYTSEGGNYYPGTQYNFSDGTVFKEEKALDNQEDRIITYSNWLNSDSIKVSVAGQGIIAGTFDFFSTSGHGNINSWQAQFPSAQIEGYLRSKEGKLYGAPKNGNDIYINAPTPKIYFATGNCLIGKPDNIDNMVYAWFHTGRAVSMFGYIVTSGYGYMGWGNYERFVHFPGIYSAAECFFITNQCLLMDIENEPPGVNKGQLEHYRDNTILYGDPKVVAYSAYLGDSASIYLQDLNRLKSNNTAIPDTFVYTVTPHHHTLEGGTSFKHFYSPYRPFQFLPARIDRNSIKIERNDGHTAAITDNFVLWDLLHTGESITKGESKLLRWTALIVEEQTPIHYSSPARRQNTPWLKAMVIPGKRHISLQYKGIPSGRLSVHIYNTKGRCVLHSMFSSNICKSIEIDLSMAGKELSSGLYFVTLTGAATSLKHKFALVR